MNIAIVGVGAMGCLFAAHLNEAASVTMIGHWSAQLAAIQASGLTVEHSDGRFSHHTIAITDSPAADPPADVALILVKSAQTGKAARAANQVLAARGIAITLQNGLGNRETLAAVLGPERVVTGTTAQGATMVAPGHVRHAGHGPTHLENAADMAVPVRQVAALFNRAGLETTLHNDVDSLIWGKLAINAGINPLTALLRVPNGFLAQHAPARRIMMAAAVEVAAVAQALSIQLPYADAGQQALTVAKATAANASSMLQDMRRGAATEIDAICGEIVRHGRNAGVATPVNKRLWQLVKEQETNPKNAPTDPLKQLALWQILDDE